MSVASWLALRWHASNWTSAWILTFRACFHHQTLALTMDASGETNYSVVVKQGQNAKKNVHASHSDIVPKPDLMSREVKLATRAE